MLADDNVMTIYTKEQGEVKLFYHQWLKSRCYGCDDMYHREDGPAIMWHDGHNDWYIDGKLHREGAPAREWPDGHREWWVNGKRHREDGPAVEYANGFKHWYRNDKSLKFLGRAYLTRYMELKNLTVAHLLLDDDPMIRENASKTRWKV